ncbi:sugar transferase [Quadrisphaera sp. DSM 44207]|uniref:sugar transferase n=1 Tax=Quadrisphaera sp. DSM 44207 TaxID=1881057 RepID=UPI00088319AD|nr:sugar transferase [Quadrisphaera sp. DSM 44207]SDQ67496.1 Undecaprenyl-phosphate galactose phosphotransferase, WbaP/exopolysaccharide biosynthesis polyprenyl glycosylphosphotransferase [Quadrisphaera sp. DSM 44207]
MPLRHDAPRTAALRMPSPVRKRIATAGDWRSDYLAKIVLTDFLAITLATALAYFVRFEAPSDGHPDVLLWVLPALPVLWLGAMLTFRAYEARFLGLGSEEFDRVLRAATFVLAAVATTSWAFKLELARGFVILALPLAAVLTLVSRYAWRRWLHARRAHGEYTQRVLVAGHRAGVLAMVRQMSRASYHGMRVAGACLPPALPGEEDDDALAALDVPVLGTLDEVAAVAAREGVEAVAVLPTPELDGPTLRRLGWDLEGTRAELFVAPAVTEVIGPRVAIRPVCGLPLLHLHRPELTGVRRLAKGAVDRTASAAGLLVLLPLFLLIALAITLDSRGPVFFRQARVGKDGQDFGMLKFRSMVTDAERRLMDLRERSEGNGVLFKMKEDPRVTRVGKVLRRYSLDELPQLINVLKGEMSLVGPRPPLASEVALYGDDVRRRLLVKPGLTGLWQINGRSDLDWDESVRLDLRYVENWSFAFDFMILWKTVGAVLRSRGAY